jgi:hypothetical protein
MAVVKSLLGNAKIPMSPISELMSEEELTEPDPGSAFPMALCSVEKALVGAPASLFLPHATSIKEAAVNKIPPLFIKFMMFPPIVFAFSPLPLHSQRFIHSFIHIPIDSIFKFLIS